MLQKRDGVDNLVGVLHVEVVVNIPGNGDVLLVEVVLNWELWVAESEKCHASRSENTVKFQLLIKVRMNATTGRSPETMERTIDVCVCKLHSLTNLERCENRRNVHLRVRGIKRICRRHYGRFNIIFLYDIQIINYFNFYLTYYKKPICIKIEIIIYNLSIYYIT